MVIPSGDLAPMRKHRRYGRHRSRWPVVLAVLAVAGVAAGAYAVQQRGDDTGRSAAPSTCTPASPARTASPAATAKLSALRLPAPGQVSLRLLNGTPRDGLGRTVGNELARRGFRITQTGNAPRPLVGASRVYYGPTGRPAALLVSAHVLGASVVPVTNAAKGAVDVVIGSTFVRLRTPQEAAEYAHQLVTSGVPVAKPAAAPSPTASCR